MWEERMKDSHKRNKGRKKDVQRMKDNHKRNKDTKKERCTVNERQSQRYKERKIDVKRKNDNYDIQTQKQRN